MMDLTQIVTCRDCGDQYRAIYMFGVRTDGTGVCIHCMAGNRGGGNGEHRIARGTSEG
jgi:hypothetical protein